MSSRGTLAASFVAVGFVAISVILLFVEPGMGFSSFPDYLDPDKVIPASTSLVWLAGDLVYLGSAIAFVVMGSESEDRVVTGAALTAAVFFVLVASLDRILAQLPQAVPEREHLEAAVLGLIVTRFGALKVVVTAVAVFAWRSTAGERWGPVWRGAGLVLLASAAAFIFVFLPMPVVFALWFTSFAFVRSRNA